MSSTAAGFYNNLLQVHQYWNTTFADEGMMRVSLPDSKGTNGTWLGHQARIFVV